MYGRCTSDGRRDGDVVQKMDAIEATVAPVVAARGLDLYDVQVTGTGRARVVRVAVDAPGGVDLDAVAEVTRAVSAALDADDLFDGQYALEVTSPGLERVLRRPPHFQGAVGSTVSIKTAARDGVPAQRRHGTLVAADDTGLEFEVDGVTERLSYDDVAQARTVFDWKAAERPGSRSSGAGRAREKAR
jgi:ribosome maturation factor RimP